jgi:DNA primase
MARLLENEHRDMVVSDMKKAIRTNKVFVDWSQNDEHKTTVAVYSLRARERPTVSTPVTWEEVEKTLKKQDGGLLVFESGQVLARIEKLGDLFGPVVDMKQKLPKLEGLDGGRAEAIKTGLEMAAQADRTKRSPKRTSTATPNTKTAKSKNLSRASARKQKV